MKVPNMKECNLHFPEMEFLMLKNHLLPKQLSAEECAFVFVDYQFEDSQVNFSYKDSYYLKQEDFVFRSEYHFEVKDHVRAKMIKQAHDMNLVLMEAHSHIEQKDAKFSPTDWIGFNEFVPHVIWRLKGKPYIAIVFASNSFDGLVWFQNHQHPMQLDKIVAGSHNHKSSKRSLNRLDYDWKI